ncbi:MAG: PAAR-like protein [Pseudomonadota bacterium]|nr:PAAR-like protein [Pseudomonadota bacterium]
MPGFLLHQGATVLCFHAGQAQPTVTDPRVKVSGQPIVTQTTVHTIAGCTLPPPPSGNGPCVTAQWVSAATRVRASGVPVLLQDSQAICTPTGTGVNVVVTQTRARAT